MIIYELPWILKWNYGFADDGARDFPTFLKARRILPHRQVVAELPCSTPESSSKTEKLKSLIKSNTSYDKEIMSKATSFQHNMDEDFGDDNEDDCYGICPPICPKK
ncbi:S ribonuclease [Pyrus ussuriensis x Pyrus communis]|uniref:S ribonuclease n=1 Tax=Pyrus ussuriensis x Pyrus communis TaxID=2448454 RepID=A0A5N5GCS0_9ROSA|nr:S ribonuclease [Pyrus ussuriensis x Pyrus communis]